jgi:hypothetical protein
MVVTLESAGPFEDQGLHMAACTKISQSHEHGATTKVLDLWGNGLVEALALGVQHGTLCVGARAGGDH